MDRGQLMVDELVKNGVRWVAWLPDSESEFIHNAMDAHPDLSVVQVCCEGEAICITLGLHMGGQRGTILIENLGLFDSGNALRFAIESGFPLVFLVGYLMHRTLADGPDGGKVWMGIDGASRPDMTEPFIQNWGIPYHVIDSDDDVKKISQAYQEAEARGGPVICLVTSANDYIPGTPATGR